MSKPRIGVLPLYDKDKDSYWMLPGYMKAIEQAGGIPFMVPLTSNADAIHSMTDLLDGFLFTGGQDLDPHIYGEVKTEACGEICGERDLMEKLLFERVREVGLPVFGICRGLQLFNALLGGTLYQDLPSQRYSEHKVIHRQHASYSEPVHEVYIEEGSLLHQIVQKDSLSVNSLHHQGIRKLSSQLLAAALAEDGLVEAVVMPDHKFMVAVQWHPELSYTSDDSSMKLFKAFVEACQT
ncbi:gamma-glutamyl-gamma-aminobutyrate hydrolase family protein [Paenibacillus sp. JX-17]|uniref:Gamma-glutamyl-gamma-aminobutyrate hydrolase family protein n=1 Tax=Paenibacillus lacisoli TaxID=3064525 RepID=A0ABT9CHH9_9BACL|nr:gamma-glutamyl-gamma-aminobutyrate hydrolase family protein [Paenibacillus sp. JX-17]MDO7908656.1 gamma-glutamyl-gamma-aminobutyrate hydrolase family protein [Paenibacillus sp. JX-17]